MLGVSVSHIGGPYYRLSLGPAQSSEVVPVTCHRDRSSSNWSINSILGVWPPNSRAARHARVISRSSPSMTSISRTHASLCRGVGVSTSLTGSVTQSLRALDIEEATCWHLERLGDVEQPFVEQPSPTVLHVDEYVARDTRTECEALLSETSLDAKCADSLSNFLTATFPACNTFRIVLTGSRWHVSQLLA